MVSLLNNKLLSALVAIYKMKQLMHCFRGKCLKNASNVGVMREIITKESIKTLS